MSVYCYICMYIIYEYNYTYGKCENSLTIINCCSAYIDCQITSSWNSRRLQKFQKTSNKMYMIMFNNTCGALYNICTFIKHIIHIILLLYLPRVGIYRIFIPQFSCSVILCFIYYECLYMSSFYMKRIIT